MSRRDDDLALKLSARKEYAWGTCWRLKITWFSLKVVSSNRLSDHPAWTQHSTNLKSISLTALILWITKRLGRPSTLSSISAGRQGPIYQTLLLALFQPCVFLISTLPKWATVRFISIRPWTFILTPRLYQQKALSIVSFADYVDSCNIKIEAIMIHDHYLISKDQHYSTLC